MWRFFWTLFAKIAMWQPLPYRDSEGHLVCDNDGYLFSRIFYKKIGEASYQHTLSGEKWMNFFLNFSSFCLQKAIRKEKQKKLRKDLVR